MTPFKLEKKLLHKNGVLRNPYEKIVTSVTIHCSQAAQLFFEAVEDVSVPLLPLQHRHRPLLLGMIGKLHRYGSDLRRVVAIPNGYLLKDFGQLKLLRCKL